MFRSNKNTIVLFQNASRRQKILTQWTFLASRSLADASVSRYSYEGYQSTCASVAAVAAVTAAIAASSCSNSCTTGCEASAKPEVDHSPLIRLLKERDDTNPLWPGGCRDEDVDAFVTQVLEDPSINVAGIPDAVERIVYKSTVRLVLNTFYFLLSKLHGFSLLDHEIALHLERSPLPTQIQMQTNKMPVHLPLEWRTVEAGVDEKVLEQVADRLLANAAVNTTMLPDALERPLYINSLRLVFRLLDILTSSFHLKICGHVLLLDLVPLHQEEEGNAATNNSNIRRSTLSSSLTRIDLDKVREVARRHAGILEEDTSELSFLERYSVKREFLAQLHASIYALLLGITDDILANAEITLLSDRIVLDVIPQRQELERAANGHELSATDEVEEDTDTKHHDPSESSNGRFHGKSFFLGCGVGAMTLAVAMVAGQSGRS